MNTNPFTTSTVAVGGYDSVAYQTQGKAVRGSGDHVAAFQGETYLFSSQENKERFEADPAKYAPAFGPLIQHERSREMRCDCLTCMGRPRRLRPLADPRGRVRAEQSLFSRLEADFAGFSPDLQAYAGVEAPTRGQAEPRRSATTGMSQST